ncbi:hypothetical protein F511_41627 [Dorcoceras hygrometricum]|uniref:Uncharacterized protein n=1 Tax=Dorcoceras hygrometricum TaxID=472368 RepID=A0A2Z7D0M0_9LAMI|nr:hypothetical protein F511_41627 [Dorcoceras hygrometricum]
MPLCKRKPLPMVDRKALQSNGAEDSMVVEPCLTVLRNLSSSVYECMKTKTQELIFRNLSILLRNRNAFVIYICMIWMGHAWGSVISTYSEYIICST